MSFLVSCSIEKSKKLKFLFNLTTSSSSTTTTTITATPTTTSTTTATTSTISNPNYIVGGIISGLSSATLQLSLNSSENLSITNSGSFQFSTTLNIGNTYSVSISSQPLSYYCVVANASGTISSADVTNVSVSCSAGNSNGPLVGGVVFNPLNLTYHVTTLGFGASYNGVNGISTDGTYIYLINAGDHTINKFNPSTSTLTLLAGLSGSSGNVNAVGSAARFNSPCAAVYINNLLYITDNGNGSIRKLDLSTNAVTTVASGLVNPYGITSDGNYLYVDVKHEILKINMTSYSVSSLAGGAIAGYADGTGSAAKFNMASSTGAITYNGTDLFVVDNTNCSIRKITTSTGVVTTIVGSPPPVVVCASTDGVGTASARLGSVDGIVSDGTNIFFAETSGSCLIRKITMSNFSVSSIAGVYGACSLLDGNGTAARINNPALLTSDGIRLYLADWGNNALRKIE